MARLDELLARLKELRGSDLHLASGVAPRLRLRGELGTADGWSALEDSYTRELMRELVTAVTSVGGDAIVKPSNR